MFKPLPIFCLLLIPGMSFGQEGAKPRTFKEREVKTVSDAGGRPKEALHVNWSYLKMNNSKFVHDVLVGVKSGKLSRSRVLGLAKPVQFDLALSKVIVPSSKPKMKISKEVAKRLAEGDGGSVGQRQVVMLMDPMPVPPKINVDNGSMDLGNYPTSVKAHFAFEESAVQDGKIKFMCISKDWHIINAGTQTGVIGGDGKPKYQQLVQNPKSGVELPIKAGQTFHMEIEVKPEAAAVGGGQSIGPWLIEGGGVSYQGSVVAHYYVNSIGIIGSSGVQLIQGQTTNLNPVVRNDTPVAQEITVSAVSTPNGVSVPSVKVNVPANKSVTVQMGASVSTNAPDANNAPIHLQATSKSGATSDGYVYGNIYQQFTTWTDSGSCGKIDYNHTITIGASGMVHWYGSLHDNSTWYGDDYTLAIVLHHKTSNGQTLGQTESGTLGAKYSGPAIDGSFDHITVIPDIAAHYVDYANAGYSDHIWVCGDFGQIAAPVGKWLLENAPAIVAMF